MSLQDYMEEKRKTQSFSNNTGSLEEYMSKSRQQSPTFTRIEDMPEPSENSMTQALENYNNQNQQSTQPFQLNLEKNVKKKNNIINGIGNIFNDVSSGTMSFIKGIPQLVPQLAKDTVTMGKYAIQHPINAITQTGVGAIEGLTGLPQAIGNVGIAAANSYLGEERFKPINYNQNVSNFFDTYTNGLQDEEGRGFRELGGFGSTGGAVGAALKLGKFGKLAEVADRATKIEQEIALAQKAGNTIKAKKLLDASQGLRNSANIIRGAQEVGHNATTGFVYGNNGNLEDAIEQAFVAPMIATGFKVAGKGLKAGKNKVANTKVGQNVAQGYENFMQNNPSIATGLANFNSALGRDVDGYVGDVKNFLEKTRENVKSSSEYDAFTKDFKNMTPEEQEAYLQMRSKGVDNYAKDKEIETGELFKHEEPKTEETKNKTNLDEDDLAFEKFVDDSLKDGSLKLEDVDNVRNIYYGSKSKTVVDSAETTRTKSGTENVVKDAKSRTKNSSDKPKPEDFSSEDAYEDALGEYYLKNNEQGRFSEQDISNMQQEIKQASEQATAKRRGRPKGSKNKTKQQTQAEEIKSINEQSTVEPVQTPEEIVQNNIADINNTDTKVTKKTTLKQAKKNRQAKQSTQDTVEQPNLNETNTTDVNTPVENKSAKMKVQKELSEEDYKVTRLEPGDATGSEYKPERPKTSDKEENVYKNVEKTEYEIPEEYKEVFKKAGDKYEVKEDTKNNRYVIVYKKGKFKGKEVVGRDLEILQNQLKELRDDRVKTDEGNYSDDTVNKERASEFEKDYTDNTSNEIQQGLRDESATVEENVENSKTYSNEKTAKTIEDYKNAKTDFEKEQILLNEIKGKSSKEIKQIQNELLEEYRNEVDSIAKREKIGEDTNYETPTADVVTEMVSKLEKLKNSNGEIALSESSAKVKGNEGTDKGPGYADVEGGDNILHQIIPNARLKVKFRNTNPNTELKIKQQFLDAENRKSAFSNPAQRMQKVYNDLHNKINKSKASNASKRAAYEKLNSIVDEIKDVKGIELTKKENVYFKDKQQVALEKAREAFEAGDNEKAHNAIKEGKIKVKYLSDANDKQFVKDVYESIYQRTNKLSQVAAGDNASILNFIKNDAELSKKYKFERRRTEQDRNNLVLKFKQDVRQRVNRQSKLIETINDVFADEKVPSHWNERFKGSETYGHEETSQVYADADRVAKQESDKIKNRVAKSEEEKILDSYTNEDGYFDAKKALENHDNMTKQEILALDNHYKKVLDSEYIKQHGGEVDASELPSAKARKVRDIDSFDKGIANNNRSGNMEISNKDYAKYGENADLKKYAENYPDSKIVKQNFNASNQGAFFDPNSGNIHINTEYKGKKGLDYHVHHEFKHSQQWRNKANRPAFRELTAINDKGVLEESKMKGKFSKIISAVKSGTLKFKRNKNGSLSKNTIKNIDSMFGEGTAEQYEKVRDLKLQAQNHRLEIEADGYARRKTGTLESNLGESRVGRANESGRTGTNLEGQSKTNDVQNEKRIQKQKEIADETKRNRIINDINKVANDTKYDLSIEVKDGKLAKSSAAKIEEIFGKEARDIYEQHVNSENNTKNEYVNVDEIFKDDKNNNKAKGKDKTYNKVELSDKQKLVKEIDKASSDLDNGFTIESNNGVLSKSSKMEIKKLFGEEGLKAYEEHLKAQNEAPFNRVYSEDFDDVSSNYDTKNPNKELKENLEDVRTLHDVTHTIAKATEQNLLRWKGATEGQLENRLKMQDDGRSGGDYTRVVAKKNLGTLAERTKNYFDVATGKKSGTDVNYNEEKVGAFGQKKFPNRKNEIDFQESFNRTIEHDLKINHLSNIMDELVNNFSMEYNGHEAPQYKAVNPYVLFNAMLRGESKGWVEYVQSKDTHLNQKAFKNKADYTETMKMLGDTKPTIQIPKSIYDELLAGNIETPWDYHRRVSNGKWDLETHAKFAGKYLVALADASISQWKKGVLTSSSFVWNNVRGNQHQIFSSADDPVQYMRATINSVKDIINEKKTGKTTIPYELIGDNISRAFDKWNEKQTFTGGRKMDNFLNLCNGHNIDVQALMRDGYKKVKKSGIDKNGKPYTYTSYEKTKKHTFKSVAATAGNLSIGMTNRMFTHISDGVFKVNNTLENFARRQAYNIELEKLKQFGYQTVAQQEFIKHVEAHPELQEQLIKNVENTLGDYNKFSKLEQKIIKKASPFYSWYRTVSRWHYNMAKKDPTRLAYMYLCMLQAEDRDKDLKEYQRGGVRTNYVNKRTGRKLTTKGLNKIDVLDTGKEMFEGAKTLLNRNEKTEDKNFFERMPISQHIASAGLEAINGRKNFSNPEITSKRYVRVAFDNNDIPIMHRNEKGIKTNEIRRYAANPLDADQKAINTIAGLGLQVENPEKEKKSNWEPRYGYWDTVKNEPVRNWKGEIEDKAPMEVRAKYFGKQIVKSTIAPYANSKYFTGASNIISGNDKEYDADWGSYKDGDLVVKVPKSYIMKQKRKAAIEKRKAKFKKKK